MENQTENYTYKTLSPQASTFFHIVTGTVLLLTTLFSLLVNGSVLHLFLKNRKLLNRMNTHICIVCLIAFIMTATGVPMVVVSSFAERWLFGEVGCIYYGFIMTFCGTATIFILTMFAVDRYILVEFYFLDGKSAKYFSVLSITGSCSTALILAICPILGWNRYTYEGIGTACALDLVGENHNGRSFLVTLLVLVFVVPVLIMAFCFTRIFLKVRKMEPINVEHQETETINRQYKAERDLAYTSLQIIVLFFLTWTPYAIVMLWYLIDNGETLSPIVASIPSMITKTSGCFTPLIYLGRNKSIRTAVYRMYPCCRSEMTSLAHVDDDDTDDLGPVSAGYASFPVQVRLGQHMITMGQPLRTR